MAAGVFTLPFAGLAAFKFYQNYFPEEREESTHQARQNTLAERFIAGGADSRVSRMSDKQFNKFVRTNSVGKSCEEKLRLHRTQSQRSAEAMKKAPSSEAEEVEEQAIGA